MRFPLDSQAHWCRDLDADGGVGRRMDLYRVRLRWNPWWRVQGFWFDPRFIVQFIPFHPAEEFNQFLDAGANVVYGVAGADAFFDGAGQFGDFGKAVGAA